jgi:alkylhydroperoxidase/carboxymuconolactone decarboxylase family protein YurZ
MDVLCNRVPGTEGLNQTVEPVPAPSPEVAKLVAGLLGKRGASGLEAKTGALAALAALTALRAPFPTLRAHVRSALDDGASREEILATVAEAALHSGFAAAHAGLEAVHIVFAAADSSYARAS